MNKEEKEQCHLYATTFQGSAIRAITETLKECVTETLIKFNKRGLHITECNERKGLITKLTLDHDKFDEFICNANDSIGISMLNFHKLLKTVSNKDVISLYLEKDDTTNLGILIQNKEKNTISNIKMHTRDLDNQEFTIPDMKFDYTFNIPCSEFQKNLRDLCIIDPNISFYVDSSQDSADPVLISHVSGEIGDQTIKIDTSIKNTGISNIKIEDMQDKFIGMFNLEILNSFFKASSICSNVILYLKPGNSLLIQFKVANIGTLEFILAPLMERIIPKA